MVFFTFFLPFAFWFFSLVSSGILAVGLGVSIGLGSSEGVYPLVISKSIRSVSGTILDFDEFELIKESDFS